MDTGYQVNLDEVFKIMQRVTSNLLHVLMVCLLRTTEAKEIHIHKYILHTEKMFTLPLSTLVIDTEMSFILTLTKPILSTKNSKSFFYFEESKNNGSSTIKSITYNTLGFHQLLATNTILKAKLSST
ncbi:hypothetical protein MS3_00005767 [Schistosoma haematobium]|uniref:Uncharacterized protein n=1 Tax=Schistosoma haematobium TaxID=6185 RepID=A0A922LLH8_SCHHA|nr:hypothetical protein MS3_00005767 [Schistosoma haematobium]KAH9588328.1 hypothetical protein MS3_00005767 [Schistosoma haematobium]